MSQRNIDDDEELDRLHAIIDKQDEFIVQAKWPVNRWEIEISPKGGVTIRLFDEDGKETETHELTPAEMVGALRRLALAVEKGE